MPSTLTSGCGLTGETNIWGRRHLNFFTCVSPRPNTTRLDVRRSQHYLLCFSSLICNKTYFTTLLMFDWTLILFRSAGDPGSFRRCASKSSFQTWRQSIIVSKNHTLLRCFNACSGRAAAAAALAAAAPAAANLAPVNSCLQESRAPAFCWCPLRRLRPPLRRQSPAPAAAAGTAPGAAGAAAPPSAASAVAAEGGPGGAWATGNDWFAMQCAHRNLCPVPSRQPIWIRQKNTDIEEHEIRCRSKKRNLRYRYITISKFWTSISTFLRYWT